MKLFRDFALVSAMLVMLQLQNLCHVCANNVDVDENVSSLSHLSRLKLRKIDRIAENVNNVIGAFFHRILPGTLWCGAGSIAQDFKSLGIFGRTDACCREHDHCEDHLEVGESMGPLINDKDFTRSACYCEHKFYNCLKNVGTPVSWKVGSLYFNVLSPQCINYDFPILKCSKYQGFLKKKCIEYVRDTSKGRALQWNDSYKF